MLPPDAATLPPYAYYFDASRQAAAHAYSLPPLRDAVASLIVICLFAAECQRRADVDDTRTRKLRKRGS